MASSPSSISILSKCTIYPERNSTMCDLKLSISDINMLCSHYIQKGCLFTKPSSLSSQTLIPHLTTALSRTLSFFPPFAGRLITNSDGHVHITCNDAGVDFIHAAAEISITDLLSPRDVPHVFHQLFPFHRKISHDAHSSPIAAVKVTELADGVFIGCAVCHAVVDGTSFWNFFNTFAAVSRGSTVSSVPDFRRESILVSEKVLRFTDGEIKVTFNADEPLRERIFSFSGDSIRKLKARVNQKMLTAENNGDGEVNAVEVLGKEGNDTERKTVMTVTEISSFQSLCALVWRAVTRVRKIPGEKTTTFRMAVNVRHRMEPKLGEYYFGNAIQGISTCALVEEVVSRDLRWCAEELNRKVREYDSDAVRQAVKDWEREPRCFPLGNHNGATVQIGSSPRFPMYDNDFGWGRPVAVRSGGANKFDGKISAFPGREGGGSVDLEVVLAPDAMAGLETDTEFTMYVGR